MALVLSFQLFSMHLTMLEVSSCCRYMSVGLSFSALTLLVGSFDP